ncbi:signal peptidase II [Rickettsiales bacterium LUAb2]
MQFKLHKILCYKVLLPIIGFAIIAFILDQISKEIIFIYFNLHNVPIVIFPFFSINFIYNYGVSFSFLTGLDTNLISIISCVALLLIIIFFYTMFNFNKLHIKLAIGIIIGASLGNIYDRIVLGGVIDFLQFHIGEYSFPIFNLADTFITIAAIILLFDLYIARRKS